MRSAIALHDSKTVLLWHPVADRVVVPFLRYENMFLQVRRGGRIEGSHGNGDPVVARWVPKQCGPAPCAKASFHLLRGLVPSNILLPADDKRRPRYPLLMPHRTTLDWYGTMTCPMIATPLPTPPRGGLTAFFGSTLLSTVIAKKGVNISSQVMFPK